MFIGAVIYLAFIAILAAGGLWLLRKGVVRKLKVPADEPWKLYVFGGCAALVTGVVSLMVMVTSMVGASGLNENFVFVLILAAAASFGIYRLYEWEVGLHTRSRSRKTRVRDITR